MLSVKDLIFIQFMCHITKKIHTNAFKLFLEQELTLGNIEGDFYTAIEKVKESFSLILRGLKLCKL